MRFIHDLSGNSWTCGSVSRQAFNLRNVDDRADVVEWLPAVVPGNVRSDLLALGRIPPLFFSDDYRASLWVEDCDWWYRRPLDLTLGPDQRAFLVFEGIDYLSAVLLNGRELGRQAGMFSQQVYEVSDALRTDGASAISSQRSKAANYSSEIAVRLWGSGALPQYRLSLLEKAWAWLADRIDPSTLGTFPDRMATIKCQMTFGWDFVPPIRTMGIWDDAQVVVTGGVFIEDVWVKSQLLDPAARLAHLAIQVTLDSDQPRSVRARVQVSPANFNGPDIGPVFFNLDLPTGRSMHSLACDLPDPQLWEPWDRGVPHMYNLGLSILGPESLDSTSTRFGVRGVTLDEWTFTINGRREFVRGVNWVPADSLPGRLRREDYTELLNMVRSAGANLVRVWGGGLREKRAFYDVCDELGLLVWQEFPFACSFLGHFPLDTDWLELAERECSAIVRSLRNHPSLVLWCGGNEFSPGRNQHLVRRLARLVANQDGTRPFLPASPSPGDVHHWGVWHGKYPLHAYRREEARFLSEFGLQAAPAIQTLRGCLPESDLWPPGASWEAHKAELSKLWRYVRVTHSPDRFACEVERQDETATLQSFIAASQQAQALGLQFAIEHMRRRKGETGGLCLWQFNEPWPAISWAIVDYWRRPKLAYQRLRDLYNPVLVGATFPPARYRAGDTLRAEVWAVNDRLERLEDCRLRIELDSVRIYETPATLQPDSVTVLEPLQHRFHAAPGKLELTLHHKDRLVAHNMYELTYYDPTPIGWRARLVRRLADMLLR
jgi:beta-mannosidase